MFAVLVDHRVPRADRVVSETSIRAFGIDQLDEWFGNLVVEMAKDVASLIDDNVWAQALWNWAWTVVCTTAPLEFMHGRNRTRSNPAQYWHNFCAASLNAEAQLKFTQQQKALLPSSRKGRKMQQAEDKPARQQRVSCSCGCFG